MHWPTSSPTCLKVTKAEWPKVPDGSTWAASPPQGEPSTPSVSVAGVDPLGSPVLQTGAGTDLLQLDTEAPALVGPSLPAEREETKTQRSGDASLLSTSKSQSWAALEGPVPTGQPQGVSKRKGE